MTSSKFSDALVQKGRSAKTEGRVSGSQYLNGHSDATIGAITGNGDLIQKIRKTVLMIRDKPDGQEVSLSLRGLRILKLRMEHIDKAAREIARWVGKQGACPNVLHPAFENCPWYEFRKRNLNGVAGLFAGVLRAISQASLHWLVDNLQRFGIGLSWGGYESLVLPVNSKLTAIKWTSAGSLVRFNIGLDDLKALKTDLSQAMPHLES